MRRTTVTLVATVGLALAPAVAGPGLASQAATVPVATPGIAASGHTYAYLESRFDGFFAYGSCGFGCFLSTNGPFSLYTVTGKNGKYYEIQQDVTGYCLQFDYSGGDKIRNATCDGDASELWWPVEESASSGYPEYSYELINDYGTKKFGHDACMWNQDPGDGHYSYDLLVKDCGSSQPTQQVWQFYLQPTVPCGASCWPSDDGARFTPRPIREAPFSRLGRI
jgi:hypothetical protein